MSTLIINGVEWRQEGRRDPHGVSTAVFQLLLAHQAGFDARFTEAMFREVAALVDEWAVAVERGDSAAEGGAFTTLTEWIDANGWTGWAIDPRILFRADTDDDDDGGVAQLRSRVTSFLSKNVCRSRHLDGGDPVCSVHGFWWPDGQQFCNGASPELALLVEVAATVWPANEEGL